MRNTIIFGAMLCLNVLTYGQSLTPEQLADLQLKGYNERNIELFLQAYSDSVKVYEFPDKLSYQGKETMRKSYGAMFKQLPDLHCTLKNRIVLGNTVIDEERVIFTKSEPVLEAVAIYKIKAGRIQEVYFIRKD
jgi:hypothetical protein